MDGFAVRPHGCTDDGTSIYVYLNNYNIVARHTVVFKFQANESELKLWIVVFN